MGKLGPRVPESLDRGKLDPRSGTAGIFAAGDAMVRQVEQELSSGWDLLSVFRFAAAFKYLTLLVIFCFVSLVSILLFPYVALHSEADLYFISCFILTTPRSLCDIFTFCIYNL